MAVHLKKLTEADVLIVAGESFEQLKTEQRTDTSIVPLSEYRDSNFEQQRRKYESGTASIDALSRAEVDMLIIQAIRFAKWIRFYDRYIERGKNKIRFRKGIEYILTLWQEHGFFVRQQGIRDVTIFTCAERGPKDESKRREWKQESYDKITRDVIQPLTKKFPWPIKLSVKTDPNAISHARHLETEHAVIRFDSGFDLFTKDGEFKRNFFTLHVAERTHLKEYRELPDI